MSTDRIVYVPTRTVDENFLRKDRNVPFKFFFVFKRDLACKSLLNKRGELRWDFFEPSKETSSTETDTNKQTNKENWSHFEMIKSLKSY